ncbi:hypothetical protein Actkin_04222 [Actinokineospora sp. UTMC 2448]|nr:hypothetical protein Actkin_04222 [Actinokineospora sp. UTMC 2448]
MEVAPIGARLIDKAGRRDVRRRADVTFRRAALS